MYTDFKPMKDTFINIYIKTNHATAQEHILEIEREIGTINEAFRVLYHRLLYNSTHKVMVQYGVK